MDPLDASEDFVPGRSARITPRSASFPLPNLDRDSRPSYSKRQETLRGVLDALRELQVEELKRSGQVPPRAESDVASNDDDLHKMGAESFESFQRQVDLLDTELRNFHTAAKRADASAHIISYVFPLRERFAHLLQLFRKNAADLFPRRIPERTTELHLEPFTRSYSTRKSQRTRAALVLQPLNLEHFPELFSLLARDVLTFSRRLNKFPEFVDEAVTVSLEDFGNDLQYWGESLRAYAGRFSEPAIQHYVHDLSGELGDQLDSISKSLAHFTEVGLPVISMNRRYSATHLQNLGTLATFFSAVTATTLQFSYQETDSSIHNAVNAFWFTSLVLSVASSVNSLLSLSWTNANCRSPDHQVPWWIMLWMRRSPLVFLVVSVASFSIGLVLFSYASHQHHITKTITTVFTLSSAAVIIIASTWFGLEWWAFKKYQGKKWLLEILEETHARSRRCINDMFSGSVRPARPMLPATPAHITPHTPAQAALPTRYMNRSGPILPIAQEPLSQRTSYFPDLPETKSPLEEPGLDLSPRLEAVRDPIALSPPATTNERDSQADNIPLHITETTKTRFANLVRRVLLSRRDEALRPRAPNLLSSTSTRYNNTSTESSMATIVAAQIKDLRLAVLTPKLKTIQPTQELIAHESPVRHMQFSPDGQFLATTSWERTSHIFRVGVEKPFRLYRVLAHPQGFVGQVAWSPDGQLLITKLGQSVKIWTRDGVCQKTIDRPRNIHSVTWMHDGHGFLLVEGSEIVKMDVNGEISKEYYLGHLDIHSVTVAEDSNRFLAVASLLQSASEFKPRKCRVENRIIVYDMIKECVQTKIPVLNDVRDITISKKDNGVLISYENKGPPELWTLSKAQENKNGDEREVSLVLQHTYMTKTPIDFAGSSYFGGQDDSLILSGGKADEIYIWDRKSGALLHTVHAIGQADNFTCIAWNRALVDPSFMFATGANNGAVHIWTSSTEPKQISTSEQQAIRADPENVTYFGKHDLYSLYRKVSRL